MPDSERPHTGPFMPADYSGLELRGWAQIHQDLERAVLYQGCTAASVGHAMAHALERAPMIQQYVNMRTVLNRDPPGGASIQFDASHRVRLRRPVRLTLWERLRRESPWT